MGEFFVEVDFTEEFGGYLGVVVYAGFLWDVDFFDDAGVASARVFGGENLGVGVVRG